MAASGSDDTGEVSGTGNPEVLDRRKIRQVIGASSAGTVFEWYDFFIYGTLATAGIIGREFFPTDNPTVTTLLTWAGFAIGFGFRPLGAILFGYLGDKLGRKYTFLVTITLMGVATAGVGLVPSYESIGMAAPIIVILLRILQGLALGGEYGGAAIYVAEHSPPGKAGFYTSFIQASVAGGFVLSLAVVLSVSGAMSGEAWSEWGWRIPFLLSLLLLAISLWMRLKLSESPVFKAMKEAGEVTGNPFVESFRYPGNVKRLLVALFGIAAGLTVIWYTAMFSTLDFLKQAMRVDGRAADLIVGAGALMGLGWFVLFGKLSDRVGRRKPILIGYALTLVLVFPLFWMIGSVANPALATANAERPVLIQRAFCGSGDICAKAAAEMTKLGVRFDHVASPDPAFAFSTSGPGAVPITVAGNLHVVREVAQVKPILEGEGYNLDPFVPSVGGILTILLALLVMTALSGATFGPVAALLSEMFPPKIRYSSMSIPYHIGTGYFGGFLPLVASYIIARSGDPYAGLWYMWAVVLMAFVVTYFWLPETVGKRMDAKD